jgi:hypothetical protein
MLEGEERRAEVCVAVQIGETRCFRPSDGWVSM